LKRQYNSILDVIVSYLVRVYHTSSTSTIIKQFSQQMATCLYERYMTPLSYLNANRARQELELMKSIQHTLKKRKDILGVTDRSDIFHIGHATDYEQKAEAYGQKTGAYIELATDSLWTIFDKVVHRLNDLRSKKQITARQIHEMMPNREKFELAYLYFIPKPHILKIIQSNESKIIHKHLEHYL
jgi:hypothetical protein